MSKKALMWPMLGAILNMDAILNFRQVENEFSTL
jgi:hypothetical protein